MQKIDSSFALKLAEQYQVNKRTIEDLETANKELLAMLVAEVGEVDSEIGPYTLKKQRRVGSVSYSSIVKEKLPELDLGPYRGQPTEFWRLY